MLPAKICVSLLLSALVSAVACTVAAAEPAGSSTGARSDGGSIPFCSLFDVSPTRVALVSFISLDQDGDAGVGYYCTQYQTQQLKAGDDVYPTGGTATDDGRTSMVSQIDNGTNGGVEEVIEVRR